MMSPIVPFTTRSLRPIAALAALLPVICAAQQYTLKGVVKDAGTGETLIGANVVIKGTTTGSTTDIDGRFRITTNDPPPYTLSLTFIGFEPKEVVVTDPAKDLDLKMGTDKILLQEAEVVGSRISDKQKQAPLTVETMDVIAIREAPSGDFYESLGNLKGVDMTAASMGFKVINTRGFNSTSPVRSLQLIDGVDNQSPGLNFSLGNFLGASDLDVMRVEVIAGASTAFYGPGAFNGVIAMTTKDPWLFRGTSFSVKGGERGLLEMAVRQAGTFGGKEGAPDRWAYKFNVFAMRAEDWYAETYTPTSDSPTDINNPGRYDGVNIYGDEDVTTNNNFGRSTTLRNNYPGLGKFLRDGYREIDLVDYGTENLKVGGALHYKINDSTQVILASNFSTGSTVYQGDNRYRLDGVQFFQHRIEVNQKDRWFLRGYLTHEDAGRTFDIFTTGIRMQDASGPTREWNIQYANFWQSTIKPQVEARPDYLTASEAASMGFTAAEWVAWQDQYIQDNLAYFQGLHQTALNATNALNTTFLDPAYVVGTERFDQKLEEIKGKRFTEGGSLFFDRSVLAHVMGERRFKPGFAEVIVGGNFRQYLPNSAGTIFKDTGDVVIRNTEFGLYGGVERKFIEDKLKATVTLRMDKNQNFNALFSPAASLVYSPNGDRTFRFSFSSAIRNPTLADQFLYYNVGRALLLGNVEGQFEEGRDSLFTLESFNDYRSAQSLLQGLSRLEYFNVDRIRPEQVRTLEVGYRGTHWEHFYFDASAYMSWYTDFIGYIIGLSGRFDQTGFPVGGLQVFRLAANASERVRTQGFNLGTNYYRKRMTYGVNYSFNKLVSGVDDPIIPAFNTPEHKFNVSFTGHDMKVPFSEKKNLGFGVNYKWIQGFTFEGSPQFTGSIPTYDMVDAQVNVRFPEKHLTVKLGASNLFGLVPFFDSNVPDDEKFDRAFENRVLQVYGGPNVGRLAYVQLIYEIEKR